MRLLLTALFCCFLTPFHLAAQVTPSENDTLNYRIIGFSFPEIKKEHNYRIEIAAGHHTDEGSFVKNIIKTEVSKTNKIVTRVPSFGQEYTWRVLPLDKPTKGKETELHHFYTGFYPEMDTANIRLRIRHSAEKYKDAYVFMDGNRTMYDMEGSPVWYLPNLGGTIKSNSQVRDVKLSEKGTITFIVDGRAFEVDYHGKVLWEGANGRRMTGDSLEGYHHELTRLSNGHYMVLGFDPYAKPKPLLTDSAGRRVFTDSSQRRTNRMLAKQQFGTIMEYDETGHLVWEWRASGYFKNLDMGLYRKTNGMPEYDIHENSFFFDEKNKVIYLSFRNISQVLKIRYPTGEVLNAYGKLANANDSMENHMFCAQHSCRVSKNGSLFLFDNGCGLGTMPKLVMMQEPFSEKDTLKKVWEYPCPVEKVITEPQPAVNSVLMNRRYAFTSGGNVVELPDNSLFSSTNSPYSTVFIVTMEKQLLWCAEFEKWHPDKKEWKPMPQYRASIITSHELLENLIWNSTQE